jgi:enoyl-CoA hydratase
MIRKSVTGFPKRSCSSNNLKRDDDSSQSHRALGLGDFEMPIEVRQADGVSVVVINRPKWNLLDMEMIEQLSAAFERHDPEQPVVLAGEGEAFSAGVDTKAFAQYDAGRRVELAQKITGMTARILAIRAPIIAAIPGHAIGGGFVLTLCADYRVAVDDAAARFALGEAKAGVSFPAGPMAIIRHELDAPLLRRLTLSGAVVSSSELVAQGIYDAALPSAEVFPAAVAAARELSARPAWRAVKAQLRGALSENVSQLALGGEEPAFTEMVRQRGAGL